MIPWWHKEEVYGSYWRMNGGQYDYKVLFYEKEGDKYSCKDKFPIVLSTGQSITKEEFVGIVREAIQQINDLDFGLRFNFTGHGVTDTDDLAWDTKDGVGAIVYYWKFSAGGLSAPFGRKDFGVKACLDGGMGREWYIGVARHEMTHALGFAHKGNMFDENTNKMPFVTGINGEMTEDTVHGFDIVYGKDTNFKILGKVADKTKYEQGQAFLVDWGRKELVFQSPIDPNGYFEFRLRKRIKTFKILILSKEESSPVWFNQIWKKPKKIGRLGKIFDLGEIKLVNSCSSLDTIEKLTKIKLTY